MDNRPIGIFDSGMGGLSVLYQAIKDLPNENYLYYADIDNVPYGLKTTEEIKSYVNNAVKFLINKNVKAIVIACNTATSVCIESLRERYTVPIIGIEPAVKPAVEINKEKRIMLIATPVTVKGEKLKLLLKRIDTHNKVDCIAIPGLVKFAESEEYDTEKVEEYLKKVLQNTDLRNYSEIILGCTHFNYFKPIIKKIFSEIEKNSITILDGNKGTINRLCSVLKENKILGNTDRGIEYYFSGKKVADKTNLDKIERMLKRLEKVEELINL